MNSLHAHVSFIFLSVNRGACALRTGTAGAQYLTLGIPHHLPFPCLSLSLAPPHDKIALGSNIRNYYRYGTFKDCAARYDHLKFCFAIKTKSSQVAQVMIQKRDAELRAKKRSMPNSEDVWTART